MKAFTSAWLMLTIGVGVVLIQQHAKAWQIELEFLFTVPVSAWSAAYWWSR